MLFFHTQLPQIDSLAYEHTSKLLYAIAWDRWYRYLPYCWEISSGESAGVEFPQDTWKLCTSLNSDVIAIQTEEQLILRSANPRRSQSISMGEHGPSGSLSLSADGSRVAFGLGHLLKPAINGDYLKVYSTDEAEHERTLSSWIGVRSIGFDPTGRYLATVGRGGFTLWDCDRGESIDASSIGGDRVCFSPDGTTIAVQGISLLLRDANGRRTRRFTVELSAIAFSADGRLLLGGSEDTVLVFDVATGEVVQKYHWPIGHVQSLACSPDGMTAAAGGDQGQIVVWDLDNR